MSYKVVDLLDEAIRNLRDLIPQFEAGSPHHNEELCRVLAALEAPELTETSSNFQIDFVPHDVNGPRSAVGNEYRKICTVLELLCERSEWVGTDILSCMASEIQLALINRDWSGFPPVQRTLSERSADPEFDGVVAEFVEAFEAVFHYDWTYTCIELGLFHRSSDKGDPTEHTFLEPGLSEGDESEDWHCRGRLLRSYRVLARALQRRGFEAVIQHPRDEDWLYGHYELTRAWREIKDGEATQ